MSTNWISFRGETKKLTDWAKDVGVTVSAIEYRIKAGWKLEDALTWPKNPQRSYRTKKSPNRKCAPIPERFWKKVNRSPTCWNWIGGRNEKGYGQFYHPEVGHSVLAHRVSFELNFGEKPKGLVLHKCNNPACVRPSHLYQGTHLDNTADASRAGRLSVKLDADRVRQIRRLAAGGTNYIELAKHFSVSQTTIGLVVRKRTWRFT